MFGSADTLRNTEYSVILPILSSRKNSKTNAYNSGMTDGKATEEEVDKILDTIDNLYLPAHKKITRATWLFVLGILVIIGLMVVGIINSMCSQYQNYCQAEYLDVTGGSLVGSIMGGIIGVVVAVIILKIYKNNVQNAYKPLIQKIFNDVNPSFINRGLKWLVPTEFPRCVTLSKEYAVCVKPVQRSTYIPPRFTEITRKPSKPIDPTAYTTL